MALIICSDCSNPISDQAPVCPRCGCPQHLVTSPASPATRTIQAAGKRWKSVQLLSVLVICIGVLFYLLGNTQGTPKSPAPAGRFGAWLIFGGIPSFFIGRLGAWWSHG